MGARAYNLINLCQFKKGETAIEIGSERGEGSTEYLKEYCTDRNIPFYSVDIDPQVEGVIKSDGADWLRSFNNPIKYAYLDNFDYIFKDVEKEWWIKDQVEHYKKLGVEMTNENSEKAHLEQARLIHDLSVYNALIVIDDTWGSYEGKGARAVPFLLKNGWRIINEVGNNELSYVALRRII